MTRESGFTLIELLVVMIIISILVAIAVPSYLHQKTMARRTQLLENIDTFRLAIEGCASSNTDGSYMGCTEHTYVQDFEPSLKQLPICCPTWPSPPGAFDVNGISDTNDIILVTPPTMPVYGYEVDAWMQDGNYEVWFSLIKWADGVTTKFCGEGRRPTFSRTQGPGVAGSFTCKTGKW